MDAKEYELRKKLKDIYQSPKWDARVDKMSAQQVFAVYQKLTTKNRKG